MSLPRYPKYKDSGFDWIGDVPEHWHLPPLYMRYEILLGKMLDEKRISGNHLVPYIRNVDVQWDRVNVYDLPVMDIEPDEMERFTLKPGDLLVCEGGEVGRAAIWCGELELCAYQKAIHRLRPSSRDEVERFLYYCFRFAVANGVFIAGSNPNTIPHLTGEKLRLYRFPRPPRDEQDRIASFLDRETTAIDALIAEQQQLIELLNEKRQAVISHAVTKGLNPDAPTKPSGTDCLGDVPAHWTVAPLGTICSKIGSGKTPLGGAEAYVEEGVLFLRSQNVYDEGLRLDDAVFISESMDDEMRQSRVLPGDVLLNITGASLGRTCLVPLNMPRANVNQHVCIIRAKDATLGEYIAMVLKSRALKGQFDAAQNGAAREGLNYQQISGLRLPVPPAAERAAILNELGDEIAKLDALHREAEQAIALLQERRTALISAAVTGKIDVRGVAGTEPIAA